MIKEIPDPSHVFILMNSMSSSGITLLDPSCGELDQRRERGMYLSVSFSDMEAGQGLAWL